MALESNNVSNLYLFGCIPMQCKHRPYVCHIIRSLFRHIKTIKNSKQVNNNDYHKDNTRLVDNNNYIMPDYDYLAHRSKQYLSK